MYDILFGILVFLLLFALCLAGDLTLEAERGYWIEYRRVQDSNKEG
jgi:hypothetical protein